MADARLAMDPLEVCDFNRISSLFMGHIALDLQEIIMQIDCQHHKKAHQATILNCEVKKLKKIIDHFILVKSKKKLTPCRFLEKWQSYIVTNK